MQPLKCLVSVHDVITLLLLLLLLLLLYPPSVFVSERASATAYDLVQSFTTMNYSKQGMSRLCTHLCVTLGSSHLSSHPGDSFYDMRQLL